MIDINERISNVMASCETTEQLEGAEKYVRLAHKARLIGVKRLYFSLGVLTVFHSMIKRKECEQ